MIVRHARIDTPHVLVHGSSQIEHEQVRGSCGHPLALLFEHAKEAIVYSCLAVMIPFLGMTSYLIGIV